MNVEKLISTIEKKASLSKRGYATHWLNGINKNQLIIHALDEEFKYQLTHTSEGTITDKNKIIGFINKA